MSAGAEPRPGCPGCPPEVAWHCTSPGSPLSPAEHEVIDRAGDLWGFICAAIPDGPTREADLRELIVHVHAIQHTFMANAAARTYPQLYRPLGLSLDAGGRDA